MANNTSGRQRLRPQVYMHFEFGMSLGGNGPPRHHEVTYRSRGLRERSSNFPRAVPARSTNYLSAPAQHVQHSHPPPSGQQTSYYYGSLADQPSQHVPIYYYGGPPVEPQQPRIYYYGSPARHPEPEPDVHSGRPSRDSRRSSHERGNSAPPGFGDNPWDVDLAPGEAPFPASTLSGTFPSPAAIDPWKALPEIPSRYRLGEDEMPWDAWSVPHGYDPDEHPQDDEVGPSTATNYNPERPRSSGVIATSPTDVSTFSIGPTGPPYRPGDPGRITELAGLSSAMVTVDNGFENQWWYQGGRASVATAEAGGVPPPSRFSRNSLGWAVASTSDLRESEPRQFMAADVTSLPSTHSGEIGSLDTTSYQPRTRSLTTRSDELFFDRRERTLDG
jgi:hypothetical protein